MNRLASGDRPSIGAPLGVTGRTPVRYLTVAGSTHLAKSGKTLVTLLTMAAQRAGLGVVSYPARLGPTLAH